MERIDSRKAREFCVGDVILRQIGRETFIHYIVEVENSTDLVTNYKVIHSWIPEFENQAVFRHTSFSSDAYLGSPSFLLGNYLTGAD